ncbi:M20/M25/M40 family metallo-hydrolase [Brachybacterium sp. GCM10030267]|uniref:M20/M25/M40 family metallo-hydrolase n=1 Tax=unclassified Brachybacterium TaxID=2623841 RepID=UPI00360E274D
MTITAATDEQLALVQDEAVRITRDLIRIDTSNYGGHDPATWGPGERTAADYVVAQLEEVGLAPEIIESRPGRANVVVRVPGSDRERGGLVIHGHLDVVPAHAEDWSVDPFAAEIVDDVLYGRGAVDMKDMDGMILAVVRHLARTGQKPPRDLVIIMFADEEAGGTYGSRWMIANRPDVFEGCTEAISEVGGYSITLPDRATGQDVRAYLLQTAEKGYAWMRLRATGRAGHGSVPNDENAIVRLSRAVAAIDDHVFPREYVASVRTLFDRVTSITGTPWDEQDVESFLPLLGGARQFVTGTLADSANVTTFHAGYKGNVIPQTAEAELDCRFLPGHQDDLLALIDELSGEHVEVIVDKIGISLDAPHETPFVDAMHRSILAEDPGAELVPYCLSAGTDNKQLAQIGIDGYGFAPLQLPADLDFAPLFHGIDERVPVDAIRFGARVLLRLVADC